MRAASIQTKIVLTVLACLAAAGIAAATVVRVASEQNVRAAAARSVAAAGRALEAMERADVAKLAATGRALMADRALGEAFAARDRERLLALAAPTFSALRRDHDVTHWYFLEPAPARTCFLRVHRPGQFGDVVERATLAKAIATNGTGSGKELGQTAFALRVVQPWTLDGRLLGYLELGEEIDHFLARMKAQTGDDYGLLVEKRFLDRAAWASTRAGARDNWDDRPETVVVNTTTGDERIIDSAGVALAAVPADGTLLQELARGGRTFARGILPVRDAAGRQVGGLFVVHDITAIHDSMSSARTSMFLVLAAIALAMSVLLVVALDRLVFGRLRRMMATMEDLSARLAGGDTEVSAPPATGPADEIGRFEGFFGRFLAVVAELLKDRARARSG